MKTYGGMRVQIHVLLILALLASRGDRFTPGGGKSGTLCIGDWVGSTEGLDALEEIN
jgi:hypothetical protein